MMSGIYARNHKWLSYCDCDGKNRWESVPGTVEEAFVALTKHHASEHKYGGVVEREDMWIAYCDEGDGWTSEPGSEAEAWADLAEHHETEHVHEVIEENR